MLLLVFTNFWAPSCGDWRYDWLQLLMSSVNCSVCSRLGLLRLRLRASRASAVQSVKSALSMVSSKRNVSDDDKMSLHFNSGGQSQPHLTNNSFTFSAASSECCNFGQRHIVDCIVKLQMQAIRAKPGKHECSQHITARTISDYELCCGHSDTSHACQA